MAVPQNLNEIEAKVWDELNFREVKLTALISTNGDPEKVQALFPDMAISISDNRTPEFPGTERDICFRVDGMSMCFVESYGDNFTLSSLSVSNSSSDGEQIQDLTIGEHYFNVGESVSSEVLSVYDNNSSSGEQQKSIGFVRNPYRSSMIVVYLNERNEVTQIVFFESP
ncbi:hypothetical protein [Roseivirga pacifica]|uniref:hypothetical protein n=1 Tax=Roseivirga pacifica TaxID=1267423 RepID=UPI00227D4F88|nr:hypothetical protein [Roseivirga pacifica]